MARLLTGDVQKNDYIHALEQVAVNIGRSSAFPLAGKLAYYGIPDSETSLSTRRAS